VLCINWFRSPSASFHSIGDITEFVAYSVWKRRLSATPIFSELKIGALDSGIVNSMKQDSQKAMIISTAFSGGGAEFVARTMVEIIEGARGVLFENCARIECPGRAVSEICGSRKRGNISKVFVNIWRIVVVQYLKLMERPRVTVSHLEGPNFVNLLTVLGGRRVIFVHNCVSENYKGETLIHKSKRTLVRLSYNTADLICCVSADVRKDLIDNYGVPKFKAEVFPNPINCEHVSRKSLMVYGDNRDTLFQEKYVISVASLTYQKNHRLLIAIFDTLLKNSRIPAELKLVLVGEGPEKESLERQCASLGLKYWDFQNEKDKSAAQVVFLGFQANPYPLLRHAQLLVMTSLWEGLPIALLEAMALGVPSVVSDCSAGIREAFGLRIDEIEQLSACGVVQASAGMLVTKPMDADPSTVVIWEKVISQVLLDVNYRKSCSNKAPLQAAEYDVEQVAAVWRAKIFEHH
jgi:glycosyltransferase involved in cell wall biosynthesis